MNGGRITSAISKDGSFVYALFDELSDASTYLYIIIAHDLSFVILFLNERHVRIWFFLKWTCHFYFHFLKSLDL